VAREPIPKFITIEPQYKKRRLFQSCNSINEENMEIFREVVANSTSDDEVVMPPASYQANG
jgi:hypothetical protein